MPFRDINPSPLPPGAYFDMVASIAPNFLAGRDAGMQNALTLDAVTRDAEFRNLLAQYMSTPAAATPGNALAPLAPGAAESADAPAQPNPLVADLVAADPARAMQAMQLRNEQAMLQRREQAMREYTEAQYVLKSENPALALRLIDKDGALLKQLEEAGLIDSSDGVSDEEALIIAQWAADTVGPMAGVGVAQPARVQSTQILDSGEIAIVTSDGQIKPTGQFARNPMQAIDLEGGRAVLNRLTGQVEMLSTADQETQAAAQRREAEQLAGTRGQTTAQRWATQIDEGFAAADSLPVLRRGLELLKGGIETGGWDAVKLWASNRLGVTGADEGELSANLGKAVLAQLRSTFGAQFTEREGARLAEIEAGFGKSTAANIRLLEQAAQLVERTAKRGITAAKNAGDDDAARMIEEALSFRITYGAGSSGGLPNIALDDNGAPIRQTELEALLEKYGGE